MITIKICDNNEIYGIEKSIVNNRTVLRWKSSGVSGFIVFYSDKQEKISFDEENADLFRKLLEKVENDFIREKKIQTENGITCYYITLDALKRDGGLPIKNRPGYYAIYGASFSDENICVFLGKNKSSINVFFMTIDVVINKEIVYDNIGIFKKKKQYSGFNRISLSSAYPSLVGGILMYNIDGYGYPFPDEVVKSGGSFYIKIDENKQINFESSIKEGIIIK